MFHGKAVTVSSVKELPEEDFMCALEGKLQIYPPLQIWVFFPPFPDCEGCEQAWKTQLQKVSLPSFHLMQQSTKIILPEE